MGVSGNTHSSPDCDQLARVGENRLGTNAGSSLSNKQRPKALLFLYYRHQDDAVSPVNLVRGRGTLPGTLYRAR